MGAPTPQCPRCGYDQSGEIASWERTTPPACPLAGRCSECGLDFLWRDILNSDYACQGSFFEHARSRRFRSFALTGARSLRPWVFWNWVRMEHAVVWRRCVLLVLVTAAALQLMLMLIILLAGLSQRQGGRWSMVSYSPAGPFLKQWMAWLLQAAWPLGELDAWDRWRAMHPIGLLVVLMLVLVPFTFLLLPQTLRRARVRKAHLARIWAYGLGAIPLVLGFPAVLLSLYDWIDWQSVRWGLGSLQLVDRWRLERQRWWVLLACGCCWLLLWWGFAAGRYLRLPHALAVATSMVGLALLLSIGVILLCGGGVWLMYDL